MMPKDLPLWKSVCYYYAKFSRVGIWQELNKVLQEKVRAKKGRKMNRSVAIFDSQSVKKTFVGGQRGYDAAKGVKGRKQHILVATLGMLSCYGFYITQ